MKKLGPKAAVAFFLRHESRGWMVAMRAQSKRAAKNLGFWTAEKGPFESREAARADAQAFANALADNYPHLFVVGDGGLMLVEGKS